MKPESLWKISAEGGICELKREPGRNMTKMKSPKVLWDACLVLEAYIRSNTASDVFQDGQDDS